jgi:hypothetical protein
VASPDRNMLHQVSGFSSKGLGTPTYGCVAAKGRPLDSRFRGNDKK